MRYDPIRATVIAALVAAACSSSTPGEGAGEAPRPTGVTPGVGYQTVPTAIEIDGDGFLVRATRSSDGGTPTIDTRHRAWLGDVELSDVTWVSTKKLTATVPAGLPAGAQTLTVENALGGRGTLDAAFTVLEAPPFSATIAASPATVNVGQDFTLTLAVANASSSDVVDFAIGTPIFEGTGTATLVSGPTPSAPATLAAGSSESFTWTYSAAAAGTLTATATATGKDALSGEALSATPPAPAQITIQTPAALTAQMIVPQSVAVGTSFDVSMTVTNNGGAIASSVTPGELTVTSGDGASVSPTSGPTPASASIDGGASQTFVWTYLAGNSPGHVQIGGAVSGTDANSGAHLSATAAPKEALLANATIVPQPSAPAEVSAGQSFSVGIRFENTGDADVADFRVAAPQVSAPYPSTACGTGPTTAPPTSLPSHQHVDLTWNCSVASASGPLDITFGASGTDSGTHMAVTGEVQVRITVRAPASLTAAWQTVPTAVSTSQAFSATLRVSNGGGTNATAVQPSPITGCTRPSAQTVLATSSVDFTYTNCTHVAGTFTLSASASGTDALTGATVTSNTATSGTITAQTPASLTAAWQTVPTTVSTGQTFSATLRVSNGGGTAASSVIPSAITGCTGPSAQTVPAASSVNFTYTNCTHAAGTFTLSASASGTDALTGATVTSNTANSDTITAQAPASLTAAWQPVTATASAPFQATLRVTNGGGTAANSVTPTAVAECGITPAAQTVAGGSSSVDFTYTNCTHAPGTFTLSASASGTDALTGATVTSNTATTQVTVN
jgi:hypothetical protein